MAKDMTVRNEIDIKGTAAAVWDALTNPEKTKKYMFGCEAVSGWQPGDALLWKGMLEGQETVFVKGQILDIRPGKLLAYTTIDPLADMEDIPENYVTVTYTLTEKDGLTTLKVSQGDFAGVADGERRYQDCYNNGLGWSPVLEEIKKLVEAENGG